MQSVGYQIKMKYTIISIVVVISIPAIESILNGIYAKYGQFPYVVGLVIKYNGLVNCGGAIITNRLILSTAHCLCDRWSHEYYYALVGTNNLNFGGYHYELESSICHEFFVPSQLANDIGFAKTQESIEFNFNVQYISLQVDEIPSGRYLTAAGWGCLDKKQKNFPDILRYDDLELISLDQCHSTFWASIDFSFLCVKTNSFAGMCAGDSGAPLVYQGRLAGISFGSSENADMFLMTSLYTDWIQQKIYQHNRDENGHWYIWQNNDYNFTHNYYLGKYGIDSPVLKKTLV